MSEDIQIGKIYKIRDEYLDTKRFTQVEYLKYIVPISLIEDGEVVIFISLHNGCESIFSTGNLKRYHVV